MSETFEIGVTLALSDGVSEGITRARNEMAAFEQMLTAGGISVGHLRKVAAEATAVPKRQSDVARSDALEATNAARIDGPFPEPVANPSAVVPASVEHYGEGAARIEAPPANIDRRDGADARRRGDAADAAPMRPLVGAVAPVVTQYPDGNEHALPQVPDILQLISSAPSSEPDVEDGPDNPAVSFGAINFGSAPQRSNDVPAQAASTTVSDYFPSSPVHNFSLGSDGHRDANPNEGLTAWAALPAPSYFVDRPSSAVSPVQPAFQDTGSDIAHGDSGQPQRMAPAAPGVAETAASNPSSAGSISGLAGAQQPAEGDVFLDGMLVGRWMSRFLAQQAGRAPTGPTGFDPRRGRLLPGATVGN